VERVRIVGLGEVDYFSALHCVPGGFEHLPTPNVIEEQTRHNGFPSVK